MLITNKNNITIITKNNKRKLKIKQIKPGMENP